MKRKIYLEIEVGKFEYTAAKDCAKRNGEKSVKAMLKNFVEFEIRNQAFDYVKLLSRQNRR